MLTHRGFFVCAFIASFVALSLPSPGPVVSAQASPAPELALAIVRPDGNKLAPFAARVNGVWKQAWPEPDGDHSSGSLSTNLADVPNVWRDLGVPIPLTWRVLVPQSLEAHVVGFGSAPTACESQAALTTDLPTTPDLIGHFAIAGAEYKWRQVKLLTSEDSRWPVIERLMRTSFDRLERAEYQEAKGPSRAVPDPKGVQTPQLKSLFGESTAGPLYAVMERQHGDPNKDPQATSTVVAAWLVPSPQGFMIVGAQSFLTDAEWKYVHDWAPQVHLISAGHPDVWIAQRSVGAEGGSEAVLSVDTSGANVLVEVRGGGC